MTTSLQINNICVHDSEARFFVRDHEVCIVFPQDDTDVKIAGLLASGKLDEAIKDIMYHEEADPEMTPELLKAAIEADVFLTGIVLSTLSD